MTRMRYAALSALIVMAAFAGAMMSSRVFTGQLVKAEQAGPGRRVEAQKWEYCAIFRTPSQQEVKFQNYTSTVRIFYFQSAAYQREEVIEGTINARDGSAKTAMDDAMNKALAKLGEDGWEMVGPGQFRTVDQVPAEDPHRPGQYRPGQFRTIEHLEALYFKRPKP